MAESVWLVSSGIYSGYQVHCVVPTQEVAQQIADKLNGGRRGAGDYFVEERPWAAESADVADREVRVAVGYVPADAGHHAHEYIEREVVTSDYLHVLVGPVNLPTPATGVWVTGVDPERVRKVLSERLAVEQARLDGTQP